MLVISISLILILLICVVNKLYITSTYYKNNCIFENRIRNSQSVPQELQIVNFGSGYARFSFSYEELPYRGYNFAQSPQCLENDFKLLKYFSQNLSENCIVFINLPIFIFAFKRYNSFKVNMKYYGILEKKDIAGYHFLKWFVATKLPVLASWKNFFHIFTINKSKNSYEIETCLYSKNEVDKMVENHYTVWIKQFNLKDTINPESCLHLKENFEYTVKLLESMIEYCLDNSWQPVLVTTPICKTLNEKFSEDFLKVILYDNIKKANIKEIPYIDLRQEITFQENIDLFWNGVDWLSVKGRKKFMKLLLSKISVDYLKNL